MKPDLDVERLKTEAKRFSEMESEHDEPSLFGVTDGKAVGTYLEHKFQSGLLSKYNVEIGSSAKGIDFPDLGIDIKVTSIKQPQSSCPYKSAKQKIYGLGYSLLIFVYNKVDYIENKTSNLNIIHTVFVDADHTADFQTTTGIIKILENSGNTDDLMAFFEERMLPVDEIQARKLAEEIFKNHPKIGYLTISNALQWRLQYSRVIEKAGYVEGVHRIK